LSDFGAKYKVFIQGFIEENQHVYNTKIINCFFQDFVLVSSISSTRMKSVKGHKLGWLKKGFFAVLAPCQRFGV